MLHFFSLSVNKTSKYHALYSKDLGIMFAYKLLNSFWWLSLLNISYVCLSIVGPVISSYKEPMITFPKGMNTERDLTICQNNAACNVVHKRFWFSPLVIRFCYCVGKSECPSDWSEENDEHTMFINPRAQLKFCEPVTSLQKCKPGSKALTTILEVTANDREEHKVLAECYCNNFNYFERTYQDSFYRGNTTLVKTQTYQCQPLTKCQTGQFCGYITERLFQTYYVCSCPQYHLCLMKDRQFHKATEVLFNGEAYRGTCIPWR